MSAGDRVSGGVDSAGERGGARDSGCIASVVQCVELPDCRTCSRESPEAFRACVSRVSVAHVRCNADYG